MGAAATTQKGPCEELHEELVELEYLLYRQQLLARLVSEMAAKESTQRKPTGPHPRPRTPQEKCGGKPTAAQLRMLHVHRTRPDVPQPGEGVTFVIYKQDPSIRELGLSDVTFFRRDIADGPADSDIAVVPDELCTKENGLWPARAEGGSFCGLAPPPHHARRDPSQPACLRHDLTQVYAVARMCLDMYTRALGVLDRRYLTDWRWNWDLALPPKAAKTPLSIVAHAGEKANAVYLRKSRRIKLYYYDPEAPEDGSPPRPRVYLCRSLDIVAHECGHAILDAIKPKLYDAKEGQPGAMHEAFGDLTALFLTLTQLDLCERVVAESKGNLRAVSVKWVTAMGEEFGAAMHASSMDVCPDPHTGVVEEHEVLGMRDANNTLCGDTCSPAPYVLAELLVGAVFDFLVAQFEMARNSKRRADAEVLLDVARRTTFIVLIALHNSPDTPDFTDMVREMAAACSVVIHCAGEAAAAKAALLRIAEVRKLALAGKGDDAD